MQLMPGTARLFPARAGMNQTYIKVKGVWAYLYRAVDKNGDMIGFYLSPTLKAGAAKRFG
ncbi:DDE-type integrase/transposase/recombinase [Aristophania vespae]|uniref:DDE-type integrase/transposase/recombinase n=1 Tax=Aristophania vespae TaxID=2697033 RepID=A0A6P1NBU1_9PROT|nr:DDE-type integrase/transposase/recombinase [Aristophania vespae]